MLSQLLSDPFIAAVVGLIVVLVLGVILACVEIYRDGQASGVTTAAEWRNSAWPSDGSACSLSAILETGDVPRRFYLSARACQGILRRAEKRGKQLPVALHQALTLAATTDRTPITTC